MMSIILGYTYHNYRENINSVTAARKIPGVNFGTALGSGIPQGCAAIAIEPLSRSRPIEIILSAMPCLR